MPSLVEIGPLVFEKMSKIGKVYRQTNGQTDRRRTTRRSEKLSIAFSSGKLKITLNACSIPVRIMLKKNMTSMRLCRVVNVLVIY